MANKTKEQLENDIAEALKKIEQHEATITTQLKELVILKDDRESYKLELSTITSERDEARAQLETLRQDNAGSIKENTRLFEELSALRSSLSASPPPPPPASDLPEGITAEDVAAKIKESAGQFTRAQAINILTRHRDRAKASAA